MVWRQPGDKPLSETMTISLWCIYALPGLTELTMQDKCPSLSVTFQFPVQSQCLEVIRIANIFPSLLKEIQNVKEQNSYVCNFTFTHDFLCMTHSGEAHIKARVRPAMTWNLTRNTRLIPRQTDSQTLTPRWEKLAPGYFACFHFFFVD